MNRSVLACLVLPLVLLSSAAGQGLYNQGTLRALQLRFASPSWYNDLVSARANSTWVSGDLVVDNQTYAQVGVRFAGNDAFLGTASDKKPISVKLDEFVSGQDLLGHDRLNLHNGFNDPTMMREVIGYDILREFMPAPRCNWVQVFINGVYWGLYVNVEQVDKTMIDEWFRGNDGNRYLAEAPVPAGRGNSALQDLGTALQAYRDAYDLKTDLGSAVNPWEDVRNVCSVLNNSTNLTVELPRVFDVDRALRYLAFFNLAANLEGYNPNGADYYLYHDEEHGLLTMLPWDMGGAFGASSGQTVAQAVGLSPFEGETRGSRPLLGRLWGQPEWRARYVHFMRTMLEDHFTWAQIAPLVARHGPTITQALIADSKKLYSLQDAQDNVTRSVAVNSGAYAHVVPGLKEFCDGRENYLRGLAEFRATRPTVSNLAATPADPSPNTRVTVTADVAGVAVAAVTVYYRSIGGFVAGPMFDDGNHGDGAANDGTFGGYVPASVQTPGARVEYYVGALATTGAGGAVAYGPTGGEADPKSYVTRWAVGQSPVSINEVMAKNVTTIADPNNEFEDWVELYNSGTQPVSLAGMYLTDDDTNPTRWQFPAGTSIPAGGTLLIWCDDEVTQPGLHASFKLSSAGEKVLLFDTDGKTVLSRVQFGVMEDDVSNGWLLDGNSSAWVAYRKFGPLGTGASPGQPNDPAFYQREFFPLDIRSQRMFLRWVGQSKLGATNSIEIHGGPSLGTALLMFGTAPGLLPIGSGLSLMLSGALVGPYGIPTNSTGLGIVVVNVPNDTQLIGVKVYMQAGGVDPQGFTLSNGAQTGISR